MLSPKAFCRGKRFPLNTLHPSSEAMARSQALQWLCFIFISDTPPKKDFFLPTFTFFITVKSNNPPCSTPRKKQELCQCYMLRGATAANSALVKLRHINEGFLYLRLYYKDLSILERSKHLIFYCLAIISFPLVALQPVPLQSSNATRAASSPHANYRLHCAR